jgi:hypothetical protein
MANPKKIIIYGVVSLVALFIVVKTFKAVHPAWTRHRLKSQISRIEPWTSSTNYSDNGWQQLSKAARAFQKADRTIAEEALTGYVQKYANDPNQLPVEQGKVYLLVRMIFEAPERGGTRIPFAQWERGNSDVNPDGTINQGWPLSWSQGKPRLVAGREGNAGPAYSIATEYDYFRYNFKPRDLSKAP